MRKFVISCFILLLVFGCVPVKYIRDFDKIGPSIHDDVFTQIQKIGIYPHVYGNFSRFSAYHKDEKSFRKMSKEDRERFISEVNSRVTEILRREASKEGYEVIILTRDMLGELGLKTTDTSGDFKPWELEWEIEKYIKHICTSAGVDAVLTPIIEFDDGGLIKGKLVMTVNIRMVFYCPLDLDGVALGIHCVVHSKNVHETYVSTNITNSGLKHQIITTTYRVNWLWEATPEGVIEEACTWCRKIWSDMILPGNITRGVKFNKNPACRYYGWKISE